MMEKRSTRCLRGAAFLCLGLLTLGLSGCLLLAAGGVAAGGAALGYYYYKGELCHNYNADTGNTASAAKAALADLGMPVVREEVHDGTGTIESRTSQGDHVHVALRPENGLTQVGVRVGVFGDDDVSAQVLGRIEAHLTAPAGTPQTPPPPPALGPIRPVAATGAPGETPPPPLAPEPVPVK
jgi:hypothetical protein